MNSKQQESPPSATVAKGSYAVKLDSEAVIYRLVGNNPFENELEWREVNRMPIDELPESTYRGVTWESTEADLWMYATDIEEES